jgi:hypothetical protein
MIPANSRDDLGSVRAIMTTARIRNLLAMEQMILIRAEIRFAKC